MTRKSSRRRKTHRVAEAILPCGAALICSAAFAGPTIINDNWLGGGAPSGGAAEYRYWLNPALWSTVSFPNDTLTTKYIANLASGVSVYLNDVPGQFNASSSTVYDLNLNNSALYVGLPLTVEDAISANAGAVYVQGTTFTVGPHAAAIDNQPSIFVTSGGVSSIQYTSVNCDAGSQSYSAAGASSLLDLHTLQSLKYGYNYQQTYTISATVGGTIDLSGLTNISRNPYGSQAQGDFLVFNMSTGTIKLDTLQSVNNDGLGNRSYNGGTETYFNLPMNYSFPALVTVRATQFNIPAGGLLNLPTLQSFKDNSVLPVPANATVTAPLLNSIAGSTVSLGAGATFSVAALTDATNAAITLGGNSNFNAPNLTVVTNASITIPTGTTFTSGILGQIDNASIALSAGVQLTKIAVNSTNFDYGSAALSADGLSSFLDLHTLQSLKYGYNYQQTYTISATVGGTIDLSGLTNISRNPYGSQAQGDFLVFNMSTGTIKLDTLQSVNNDGLGNRSYNGGTETYFNLPMNYSFPALVTVRATQFNIPAGGLLNLPTLQSFKDNSVLPVPANATVTAPLLNSIAGSTVSLGAGATFSVAALTDATNAAITLGGNSNFNAPNLTVVTNASITIPTGTTFTSGILGQIDNASIALSAGVQLTKIAVNSTNFDYGSAALSADGLSSFLDLHTLQSLKYGYNYQQTYTISATVGGTIDLSGLTNISRNPYGSQAQGDFLVFNMSTGTIKLDTLQSVNNDGLGNRSYNGGTETYFNLPMNYSFPALVTVRATQFNIPAGGLLNLPTLQSFNDNCVLSAPNGGTVTAPLLNSIANSTISAAGNATITLPSLKNITNASISVTGGSLISGPLGVIDNATITLAGGAQLNNVTAHTLNMTNGGYSLSGDGPGTLFDLHTIQSLTYGAGGGQYGYGISATNNAVFNLSGLTAIARTAGQDDLLYVSANSGATINLSSLQSINNDGYAQRGYTQARFSAGAGATIKFGSLLPSVGAEFDITDSTGSMSFGGDLQLGSGSILNASNGSTVTFTGKFTNGLSAATAFQAGGAVFRMTGTGAQTFEVAGADVGAVTPGNNGNYALGQLQIGTTPSPLEVDLKDATDNGDRGTSATPEALYLNGANGQGGLILNGGSLLVLGGLNAYVKENGSWISLQGLFTGSQTIVPFNFDGSDGYITRSTSQQTVWINPNSGLWDTGTNWSTGAAPGYFNDVIINPLSGVTVTGPAASTTLRSITVDALAVGTTTALNLSGTGTTTVVTTVQASGRGQINLQAGSLVTPQLNVIGTFTTSGNSTLKATAVSNTGTLSIGSTAILGTVDGTGTMNVANGAVVTATYIRQGSVTINGTVALTPRPATETVSTIGTLSFGGSAGHWIGTLDLANNDLILTGTTLSAATSFVAGSPLGSGAIESSTAMADPAHLTMLGVILNKGAAGQALFGTGTASGTFDGQSPGNSAVLVKYTYFGDANLDGKVDGSDYSLIDSNYLSHGSQSGWYNGDFNYDGILDGSDYTLIDNAFNNQGAVLTSAVSVATAISQVGSNSTVPEPTAVIAGVISAGLLMRRRRPQKEQRRVDWLDQFSL